MYTLYVTGPKSQISVTHPNIDTIRWFLTHLRTSGRTARIWGHAEKAFV